MTELLERLFPICRSLTGDGVRQTLDIVGEQISLERTEVPTGTQVYDWTVPREWNIRGARLDGPEGRVCDFADSNLHVLGYSVPVNERLSLAELRPHLFSDPERPEVIPYRTSYHNENWGFCLPHELLERLPDGEYEAVIDSTLEDGSLTYAEHVVPGESDDEVLLSTYVCHPSLANDNLSGIVLLTELAKRLAGSGRRYTYRFLFSPATLGPLTWLSRNEERLDRIKHGLVACCVGDPGPLTYKRSRRGDAEIDRAAGHVVRARGGRGTRLVTARGRRAPVRLAGIRPPGRRPVANAAGRVPRLPLLGRRPHPRPARAHRGLAGGLPRGPRNPGERVPGRKRDVREHEPEG